MRVRLIYLGRKELALDPTAAMSGTHRAALLLLQGLRDAGCEVEIYDRCAGYQIGGRQVWPGKNVIVSGSEGEFRELHRRGLRGAVYWLENPYRLRRFGAWIAAGLIQHVVCVSDWHRRQYRILARLKKVSVIPNMFVSDAFREGTQQYSVERRLLFLGAPVPGKGVNQLLSAWRKSRAWRFGELVVSGSATLYGGEAQAEVLGQPGDVGLNQERITYTGAMDHRQVAVEAARARAVIVNPKAFGSPETFCNAAAEALYLGRPVIGGDYGALRDYLSPRSGSIRVQNEFDLAAGMIDLLSAPDSEICRRQDAARRWSRAVYCDECSVGQWISLFEAMEE